MSTDITSTDIASGPDGINPRLALDFTEVADFCDLLKRAAELLTRQDGCCHQIHQTPRWRDSHLVAGWLTDLANHLDERSHTALDAATAQLASQPIIRRAAASTKAGRDE
jgi:hypothetical protein